VYSKTTHSLSISCHKCSHDWDLHGFTLPGKSSREEWNRLRKQLSAIEMQVTRIKDEVLAGYFARKGIKTAKAEWEEMKTLGFFTGSLPTYRFPSGDDRLSPGVDVRGEEVDHDWLMREAGATNAKARLEEQERKVAETCRAAEAAQARIERVAISDLEPLAGL
jgi:hypothetical protein